MAKRKPKRRAPKRPAPSMAELHQLSRLLEVRVHLHAPHAALEAFYRERREATR